jgi:hypothetical protein
MNRAHSETAAPTAARDGTMAVQVSEQPPPRVAFSLLGPSWQA